MVARLSDQTPLLIDQQAGQGRILVFASTFDNVANDFPLHASFVPFVEQAARYLGRLDDGPAGVPVGSFAELRDSKAKGAAVEVIDPHGKRALSPGGGRQRGEYPIHRGGFLRDSPAHGARRRWP